MQFSTLYFTLSCTKGDIISLSQLHKTLQFFLLLKHLNWLHKHWKDNFQPFPQFLASTIKSTILIYMDVKKSTTANIDYNKMSQTYMNKLKSRLQNVFKLARLTLFLKS